MAELAEIYSGLLDGAIKAVESSEREHLTAHVEVLSRLAGATPDADTVKAALAGGWMPDYFIGAELQVAAQLTMSTSRQRQVDGKGSVTFGPVQIQGGLSETFQQGTQTNLSVSCVLTRQSRSSGLDYALQSLGTVAAPSVPTHS